MFLVHRYLFLAMWLGWSFYWGVAAVDVKATVRRESARSRLAHVIPLLLAFILLGARRVPLPYFNARFLPLAEWPFWLGAVIAAGGLLFAIWARGYLGGNWSGTVTLKQGHELVTHGPYAIVRHPIYTGLLLGLAGTAVARAEWRGVLAVALVFFSLWRKLKLEERWMGETFGAAYEDYRRGTRALAPFLF